MDPNTQIRKLIPRDLNELISIIEVNESWKILMARIPKSLHKETFCCNITTVNTPKYTANDFRKIENEGRTGKRSCSAILFDEWSTSGSVLPRVGHLLYLLESLKQYKAADYISVKLLKRGPVKRPDTGPEARVDTNLPELEFNTMEKERIEKILNNLHYTDSAIAQIREREENLNLYHKSHDHHITPPKIIISDSDREIKNMVVPKARRSISNDNVSDMIKFSQTQSNRQDTCSDIPNITILQEPGNEVQIAQQSNYLPDLSFLGNSSIETNGPSSAENASITDSYSDNLPASEIFRQSENSIPEILLNSGLSDMIPKVLESGFMMESSTNIPNITELMQSTSLDNTQNSQNSFIPIDVNNTNKSNNSLSPQAQQSSRETSSPLPSLVLKTTLPHFNYAQLEKCTENFNTAKHTSGYNGPDNGRFLGSGAFGAVFLALGLTDRPVAVKKLNLQNINVVTVDDAITKQFRTEVEILYKFNHENLLSLVGYSCDGPTYCLLYDYISGGTLNERLKRGSSLKWKARFDIGYGTAKAVSYLHTTQKTPLIHRDIKSANILLDCSDVPKLCDFGLIKLVSGNNTSTGTVTAIGTAAYMAPEAFRGDVSVKVDTYSFGVVLLELLTGLPPLDETRDGCDLVTYVTSTCNNEIEPLLDKNADDWVHKDINFGLEIFNVANKCLNNFKLQRPTMVEATNYLAELAKKLNEL